MRLLSLVVIYVCYFLLCSMSVVEAADNTSERQKAHIVSRVYQITYGVDELCQRFDKNHAPAATKAVSKFKSNYPELMQLVQNSAHFEKAKNVMQATMQMLSKRAVQNPQDAGCGEALWLLEQYNNSEKGKVDVSNMVSILKK